MREFLCRFIQTRVCLFSVVAPSAAATRDVGVHHAASIVAKENDCGKVRGEREDPAAETGPIPLSSSLAHAASSTNLQVPNGE